MLRIGLIAVVLSLVGCKGLADNSDGNTPLAPPAFKPTAYCLGVEQRILRTLERFGREVHVSVFAFSEQECAVTVSVDFTSSLLPVAQQIRTEMGSSTDFSRKDSSGHLIEKVSLWLSEPQTRFVPIVDPDTMQALDTTETLAECRAAADFLRETFPRVDPVVKEYAPGFRSLCYVSLEFSYLFDFEEFLSWHNPTTAYGQTTQIEFSRPTGIIAVVHILPLFKEPVH